MIPPLSISRPFMQEIVTTLNNTAPQYATFAGKEYPLEPLDERTPLLFQWFEANPGRFREDDVPVINTADNPYLNNIINAATIEKERTIGLFVDGKFLPGQKDAFSRLESHYENIKVIYREEIDFSLYDRKLSDIYLENIHEQEALPENKRDHYLLDILKKALQDIPEGEDSLIKSYASRSDHSWFDLYRNLALLKASRLFLEADKHGCYDLSPNGGCIYFDADMVLTGKLGVISIPDGIALHVDRREGGISLENGIIAVNRDNHPALLAGLAIMHHKVDAHPYYDGICRGIRKHFDYYSGQRHREFCNFVEFKHKNIIMNTSQFSASSW